MPGQKLTPEIPNAQARTSVPTFIRESPLCRLAVVPVGGAETERSFSFLCQIHSWLRTTTTEERLGNTEVLAVHGFKFY